MPVQFLKPRGEKTRKVEPSGFDFSTINIPANVALHKQLFAAFGSQVLKRGKHFIQTAVIVTKPRYNMLPENFHYLIAVVCFRRSHL